MDMVNNNIALICALVLSVSNTQMSDGSPTQLPEKSPVVVRRESQTACGYDSVYVLLRFFNKDIDQRKLQKTLSTKERGYSSFEDLRRIIDNSGLYSLCIKGDKWCSILSDAVGIGYRGNPNESIGDFYVFAQSRNTVLLFLPPDMLSTLSANKFITRTNRGQALLVFRTQAQKYWTLVKLLVSHHLFVILSAATIIFATYMCFALWRKKDKRINLVYGFIILSVPCLTLLYTFIPFHGTSEQDNVMIISEKNRIDVGCGNEGEEKDFEIPIKNVGKRPILINRVLSSCSCVSLNFPEDVLKPNEICKIKGLYKYPKSGDRNANVYLLYNNGDSLKKIVVSGRNCKMATVNKKRLRFGQMQQNMAANKQIRLRCFIDKHGYFPPLEKVRTSTCWLNASSEEIEEHPFKGFKSYRITVSIATDIAPLGTFQEKVFTYLDDPDAKEIEIELFGAII